MWDFYTSLKHHLGSGHLIVICNDSEIMARWFPCPEDHRLNFAYMIPASVLNKAVSVDDLAEKAADIMTDQFLSGFNTKVVPDSAYVAQQELEDKFKPPAESECCPDCGAPVSQQPIAVDGEELVEAVMEGIRQADPELNVSHQSSSQPGFVLVFSEGLLWFTFHAPYFMPLVSRRTGKFKLSETGHNHVQQMVREMSGIESEGTIQLDAKISN